MKEKKKKSNNFYTLRKQSGLRSCIWSGNTILHDPAHGSDWVMWTLKKEMKKKKLYSTRIWVLMCVYMFICIQKDINIGDKIVDKFSIIVFVFESDSALNISVLDRVSGWRNIFVGFRLNLIWIFSAWVWYNSTYAGL